MAYGFASIVKFIFAKHKYPLLFRGDSHLLVGPGRFALLKKVIIGSVYNRMSACLYVGSANRDYFLYYGVEPKNLFHSPHAVDNERFLAASALAEAEARSWRAELNIPIDGTVLLFAGKFEAKKQPLQLMEAFLKVAGPKQYLVLVGDGDLAGEVKEMSAGQANVRVLPFQNQTRMPTVYCLGDVLILPSVGRYETWGLCVNEAMCMARPVIVSHHVGCQRDLVDRAETGWVFDACSRADLERVLVDALRDRSELIRRGTNARRLVQRYDYSAATNGLLEAASQVCSNS